MSRSLIGEAEIEASATWLAQQIVEAQFPTPPTDFLLDEYQDGLRKEIMSSLQSLRDRAPGPNADIRLSYFVSRDRTIRVSLVPGHVWGFLDADIHPIFAWPESPHA